MRILLLLTIPTALLLVGHNLPIPCNVSKAQGIKIEQPQSLYQRLGGYDAISAVVDEFADRLFKDEKINQFFRGMSTDTKELFKQKNKNLLCAATGGPAKVISRDAKTAHAGLMITEGDFKIVAGHLKATLDKFKVPKKEQEEVFAIIGKLKPDIVERATEKLSKEMDQ